jgi:mannose-6-phosphate isomerase-like protein (cupin superfamily)
MTNSTTPVRLLAAGDQAAESVLGGVRNRFMIDGAANALGTNECWTRAKPPPVSAPMHRHRDEDEFTYVLTGRIGAVIEGQEVVAEPGDVLFKPRGQWHTFWNAGDEPATCLELISPAGLEDLFRSFAHLSEPPTPEVMAGLAAEYGCEIDFATTMPLVERLGLVM